MKIYVYVIDDAGRLRGVMTLHELLNAPPRRTVAEVMQSRVISLSADESIFSVIRNPYWQSYHALPVIDANGLLLGVIRQKSIHHYMDQLDHVESLRTSLDLFTTTGELFAYSAGQLLGELIVAGGALLSGKRHSGVKTGGND
jgi:predicted transcriptional regulator